MLPAYTPLQPIDSEASGSAAANSLTAPARSSSASGSGKARSPQASGAARFRRVPASRSLMVMNQLAVMSQNGVEIADALEIIAVSCQDKRLAESLHQIHEAISSGSSFSAAVDLHGDFFPPTLAPMLAAAEATGDVPAALQQACARLRGELEMRGTIIGALIYPIILIAASMIVMTALITGVLPQFGEVFDSIGKPVPTSTQLLLSLGDWARNYWMLMLPAGVGFLVALICLRNHPLIRRPLSRFLMFGPLIRHAYRPLSTGRNFRTIAAMVRGGVPMLQAVQLTRRTTQDLYWQALLDAIEEKLIDGMTASSALTGVDFLPTEAAQMLATAERTGRVGEVLEDIGEFYEAEASRRIKRLIIGFEPVIILIMGIVVAGVVMSVMLPLLDVSTIG